MSGKHNDKPVKRGFFITLEGGEACGKSTQLKLLEKALASIAAEREIIFTRSPGGTKIAERIRSILKTSDSGEDLLPQSELLLFGACHAQMTAKLIRPALAREAIVISDRFYDSTTVYQGYARKLPLGIVQEINRFACEGLTPDLTILLDIDVHKALERVSRRASVPDNQNGRDRFDSESVSFHQAIRNGFLKLAGSNPERFAVINAENDEGTVHKQIMEALRDRLGIF